MIWRAGLVALTVGLSLAATPVATASTRLVRSFSADKGLEPSKVLGFVQDDAGYLWLGTYGGVLRYDGRRFERWVPDVIGGETTVFSGAANRIYAAGRTGVYEINGRQAHALTGPPELDMTEVYGVVESPAGLWLRTPRQVWLRRVDGSWSRPLATQLEGNAPLRLVTLGDRLLVTSLQRGYWIEGEQSVGTVEVPQVRDAVTYPAGGEGIAVITAPGEILALRDGERQLLHRRPGAVGSDLVTRGTALWATYDNAMVRIEPGHPPELLDADDGIELGGHLLVDHEGSLWKSASVGVHQFPEPDTVAYGGADGLPSSNVRFLGRDGDRLLVSTWHDGHGTMEATASGWRIETDSQRTIKSRFCRDAEGWLWSFSLTGPVAFREGEVRAWELPSGYDVGECSVAKDGTVWLANGTAILHSTDLRAEEPTRWFQTPADAHGEPRFVSTAFEHDGSLFAAVGEQLCSTSAPGAHDDGEPTPLEWSCETVDGIGHATDVARMADGGLWMSTAHGGVYRLGPQGWRQLPASRNLPAPRISGLVNSESGGTWILGHGTVIRAEPSPDGSDWVEVERLSSWNGLPGAGGTDLLEEADGSLWITTATGVVHVPAAARNSRPIPPARAIVGVEGAASTGEPIRFEVGPAPNDVQLDFNPLSFRDPSRLEYRVRRGDDGPWSSLGSSAQLKLVDLPAGTHVLHFGASTDGRQWASSPPVTVVVAPSRWAWPLPWLLLVGAGLFAFTGLWFGRGSVSRTVLLAHAHNRDPEPSARDREASRA